MPGPSACGNICPVTQRSHWVTLEGGEAPNVVPDRASTWYFIRDLDDNVEKNFRWALDCAKGAALMTQTDFEVKTIGAIHQRFPNKRLAELVFENIQAVGKPAYTGEEESFARALQTEAGYPVIGMEYPCKLTSPESEPLRGGSSDVGDVTLVTPTVSLRYPVRVPGSPSHHWTVVAASATSIAHKGITAGGEGARPVGPRSPDEPGSAGPDPGRVRRAGGKKAVQILSPRRRPAAPRPEHRADGEIPGGDGEVLPRAVAVCGMIPAFGS